MLIIGIECRQQRANVARHLRALHSARSKLWSALALTVELGVVYCVIWVRPKWFPISARRYLT